MSDHFEDELRATMRAHDHEAPVAALPDFRADDGPRVPTGGRYTWLPIAAAAAAVATLVGITFALGPGENRGAPTPGASTSTTTASSPLTCPAKYLAGSRDEPWVPTKPTGTVDGKSSLAPNATPTSVVVCAYLHPSGTSLTGTKPLSGNLNAVTETLAWLPADRTSDSRKQCFSYRTVMDADNYLIGLNYAAGTVWVAAPGQHCEGAFNGYFRTSVNLRSFADASYRAGHWTDAVTTGPLQGPCDRRYGRLGQDTAMVPGTPASVTNCAAGTSSAGRSSTDVARLVRALNALPTLTAPETCRTPTNSRDFLLRFDYAVGPPVWVRVSPGCRPAIDNGALQALDGSTVTALIADLLK